MDESLDPALAKEAEGSPKEKALKALKEGYSILETDIPEVNLTPNQKAEIVEAKRKIADLENGGTGTEPVELKHKNGKVFKVQEEGIPVYELVEHLNEKHKTLDPDSPEAKELLKIMAELTRKSITKDYLERDRNWSPRNYQARIREEVERMKADGRSTGDPLKDSEDAETYLGKRRDMMISPEKEDETEKEDPRFTISFVNADDDAKKMAREGGAEYVRAQLHVDKGIHPRQWMRAIKFRLGEEYYKYTNAQKIEKEQINKKQYFMDIDSISGAVKEVNEGGDLYKNQMAATAERFSRKGEVNAGEDRELLASAEINSQINDLVTRFAKGELTAEQFASEQEIIKAALTSNPDTAPFMKDAKFVATEMLPVAEKVKLSYERGKIALDKLDQMLDIQIGRAVMAATTEADYSRMEKTMNFLKGGKYRGWLANPLFIGVAFGVAGGGLKSALGLSTKAAVGIPIASTAMGGLFAGWRRWTELKSDRELQERDATYSKIEDIDSSPRRKKIEDFTVNRTEEWERVSAEGLLAELTTLTKIENPTESQVDEILKKAAEVSARINFGVENKI